MPRLHPPRGRGACAPQLPHSRGKGSFGREEPGGPRRRPRLPPAAPPVSPASGASPLGEGVILTSLSSGQGWPLRNTQPRPFRAGASRTSTQHLGLQRVRTRGDGGTPGRADGPRESLPSPTAPAGSLKPADPTGAQQVTFLSTGNATEGPLRPAPLCSCKFTGIGHAPEGHGTWARRACHSRRPSIAARGGKHAYSFLKGSGSAQPWVRSGRVAALHEPPTQRRQRRPSVPASGFLPIDLSAPSRLAPLLRLLYFVLKATL